MDNEEKTKARSARAAYMRAWRKKNPERAKAINDRYWVRKAEREATEQEADHGSDQNDQ